MEAKWFEGIWLGKRTDTDEHIIYVNDDLRYARSIRTVIEEKRWNADLIDKVKVTLLKSASPEAVGDYDPIFPQRFSATRHSCKIS